jgi:hypothetical protein
MRRLAVLMSFGFLLVSASTTSAQDVVRPQRSSIDGVELLVGRMDYDLSGTGATKALTSNLSLEFGGTFTSLEQQFGRSAFLAPEARLTYSWGRGRFRPFVSGGGGIAVVQSDVVGARWRSSLAAGGGARIYLTDGLYAVGELRLRGLSSNFAGSTGEFLGGIGWELG